MVNRNGKELSTENYASVAVIPKALFLFIMTIRHDAKRKFYINRKS